MAKISLLLLSALFSKLGNAHPLDLALVNLEGDSSKIHVTVGVHPAIAQTDGEMAPFEGIALSLGGAPCEWTSKRVTRLNPQVLNFDADARCGGQFGPLELKLPFLKTQTAGYRAIVQSRVGGKENVGDATPERPLISFEASSEGLSFSHFVRLGVEHIAEGTDHILFVLALLLAGGSLISLLKTVSGFTVGHSLTLALASFGMISVPSKIVESAIALSIVIIAVESLFMNGERSRWKLALGFGLVHGLGFASAISELGLKNGALAVALSGFNVGVELAQAAIVTAAFPVLLLLRPFQLARRYAIPAFSLLILAAGSFWLAERASADTNVRSAVVSEQVTESPVSRPDGDLTWIPGLVESIGYSHPTNSSVIVAFEVRNPFDATSDDSEFQPQSLTVSLTCRF